MNAPLIDINVGWTPDLSVGSTLLDARNLALLDALSNIDRVIAAGVPEPGAWLRGLLVDLENLLAAEETELAAIDYPELAFHRLLHDHARGLIDATSMALEKADGRLQIEVIVRTRGAELSVWLMRHVQDADKLFFSYIDMRYRQPTS